MSHISSGILILGHTVTVFLKVSLTDYQIFYFWLNDEEGMWMFIPRWWSGKLIFEPNSLSKNTAQRILSLDDNCSETILQIGIDANIGVDQIGHHVIASVVAMGASLVYLLNCYSSK